MNADPKELLAKYEPKDTKGLTPDVQFNVLRYSPCGKFLVAAAYDGSIRRWDATQEPPALLPPLAGHNGWVTSIEFAAGRMYSADSWGRVIAWNYADAQPQPVWKNDTAHDGWIRMLAVSPDGSQIATCGIDHLVRVWSAADGKKLFDLAGHEHELFALTFHPDGKNLVSGDLMGVVKQWDLAGGGKPTRQFDATSLFKLSRLQDVGGLRCMKFDPKGAILAVGGVTPAGGGTVTGQPTILIFDWASGKLTNTHKVGTTNDCFVIDMHFHADGFIMAVTTGTPGAGKLLFLNPADSAPFYTTNKANCQSLAVHPQGRRLAVAGTNGGSNGNGRPLKNGEYVTNHSPVYLLDMPAPKA